MAVDPITGLEITSSNPEPSRAQERITELSDKVRQEAEARQALEKKNQELERKAAFAEGYADILSTNPGAKEHKADIEAKVMAGYTVQDATFAVLGAAGKLGAVQAVPPPPENPAGGSATNAIPQQQGSKPVGEMTQAERRAKLADEIVWQ